MLTGCQATASLLVIIWYSVGLLGKKVASGSGMWEIEGRNGSGMTKNERKGQRPLKPESLSRCHAYTNRQCLTLMPTEGLEKNDSVLENAPNERGLGRSRIAVIRSRAMGT